MPERHACYALLAWCEVGRTPEEVANELSSLATRLGGEATFLDPEARGLLRVVIPDDQRPRFGGALALLGARFAELHPGDIVLILEQGPARDAGAWTPEERAES